MEEKSEVKTSRLKGHVKRHLAKAKENPWIISTVIVGIVALVLLILLFAGSGVSSSSAGKSVVDFAKSQGVVASLVSSVKEGSLYKVTVDINSQQVPVYVTLDGKFLVQQPIPLTGAVTTDSSSQQTATPQNVPKSDKPVVDLFVMSYCPYGTQMEKGILPVVSLLKDKIDFKIRWVSYAMHGKKEVDENTVQYCIQKDQSSKYLSYLQCFLGSSDEASCLTSSGVDKNVLNSCVASADSQFKITELFNDQSSWLNGQFPQYNIDKVANEQYGVQGSPTLVINGVQVQSGRSPQAVLSAVCSSFNNAPSECSTSLATETPSAGFGYGSSGADSSAAACGV
ncbi:MAG: thioredoxin domain-containing protein [Nanoarchaeota archaeon]